MCWNIRVDGKREGVDDDNITAVPRASCEIQYVMLANIVNECISEALEVTPIDS